MTMPSTAVTGSPYSELLKRALAEGLLDKRPAFYLRRLVVITVISAALWAGVFGVSQAQIYWLAYPLLALLGVMAAQYGFIGHEAAHRQVFRSNAVNDWVGRILANLFAGLSYGFWLRKHNRHHAKPNQVGYDPDIALRVLSFTTESLESKRGAERRLSKNQGWLFPLLLCFTGFDLLLDSIIAVGRRGEKALRHRVFEFSLMMIRQLTPVIILLVLFPPVIAGTLWLTQMMAFGLFMGGAFAPNHKAMPLVPRDAKIDFFERQVLTSRNIRSTWWTDNLMGGLNFQVEHHLFPSMARPFLHRAHELVTAYCAERDVPFTETGLFSSYGMIIRYLNEVGLSNNTDPFVCPMIAELRPRN